MSEPKYLTCAQVADRLCVSERQVQRMAKRGELAHVRVGRSIRIRPGTVVEFERAHTVRS